MLWTRRTLLKHASTLAAAFAIAPFTNLGYLLAEELTRDQPQDADQPPEPLGRITTGRLAIRTAPRRDAQLVRYAHYDEVFTLLAQATGDALLRHNPVWFKVEEGWLYSSFVQPVRREFHTPEPVLAAQGFWGQVSVPFVEARAAFAAGAVGAPPVLHQRVSRLRCCDGRRWSMVVSHRARACLGKQRPVCACLAPPPHSARGADTAPRRSPA